MTATVLSTATTAARHLRVTFSSRATDGNVRYAPAALPPMRSRIEATAPGSPRNGVFFWLATYRARLAD